MTVRREDGRTASGRTIDRCAHCCQDTSVGEGCTSDVITYPDGTIEEAIPYGEEGSSPLSEPPEHCRACGAPRGGYHHPFCPVEECPRCGCRLMRCGCLDTDCVSRQWPE